jgi:hypothetical protein
VPTRTYLTTPPGRSPSEAVGRSASEAQERYVPGLAAPVEPDPPTRWPIAIVILAAAALAVALAVTAVQLSASSQAQDPSLDDPSLDPELQDAAER